MNKKKIVFLLIAAILAIGVVGGTFALFTSTDSITNKFSTATTTDAANPDGGVTVQENFPNPGNIFPGMNMTKEVSVKGTANYEQLLRAKIEKVWKNTGGEVITHYVITDGVDADGDPTETIAYVKEGEVVPAEAVALNYDRIRLNFAAFGAVNGNTWAVASGEVSAPEYGYYYYNQVLAVGATTSQLLQSVDFVSADESGVDSITDKDNYYKNLKFDVVVTAEGVQLEGASVGNEHTGWESVPDYIYP